MKWISAVNVVVPRLMMRKSFIALALCIFTLSQAACAASTTCVFFIAELGQWGINPNRTMELTGQNRKVSLVNGMGHSFDDVAFHITEQNVAAVAQELSGDYTAEALEVGLRKNLANGFSDIPLKPFLAKRVQQKLGTSDTQPCYHAALNFHQPYEWDGSADNSIAFLRKNYTTIGYADTLQFGDILLFWSQAEQRPFTFHIAVYLGGDIVYHKYGPIVQAKYEFHTLSSLYYYYAQPALWTPQHRFFGKPFMVEMLRYDPLKQLPPPRRRPR